MIPFVDLTRQSRTLRTDVRAAIERVLDSGQFVQEKEGEAFERDFAEHIGARHGVGVNSGTDALKIALKALSVGPGDEVITVANTAVPTVSAIRETGAIPVFVDIDEYFTMDAGAIEAAITQRTKAVLPVHLYGQTADMPAIMHIARAHGLFVVEDCAQAVGANMHGQNAGTLGDIAAFSFYPTKNLGTYGSGGMILTNDDGLAATCRRLRYYGTEGAYHAKQEGYHSRLDGLQAAILRVKLPYLAGWTDRREEIARAYRTGITNRNIVLPLMRKEARHVFHLFAIRTKKRDECKKYLETCGIGSSIHYEFPIHLQDAYAFLGYAPGSLPNTEGAAGEILSLPLFPELTDEEVSAVINAVNTFSGSSPSFTEEKLARA